MRADEIPAFVDAVVATGCDICAVGHDAYVIGDADLSEAELIEALPKLRVVEKQFGERDFLKMEIVAHLRSLGRYIDSWKDTDWRNKGAHDQETPDA